MAYHLEYVDKPGTFDEVVQQDGIKVLIDSKALFSIIGSEMDWVEDELSTRFAFKSTLASSAAQKCSNDEHRPEHQGRLRLRRVLQHPVTFAFVRATEFEIEAGHSHHRSLVVLALHCINITGPFIH